MARPKIVWGPKEWASFEELCGILCTQEEICRVLGVTDKTLARLVKEHYGADYRAAFGRFCAGGKAGLRKTQFELAKKSATMAIWLGKQYLGQGERQEFVPDTSIVFAFEDGAVTRNFAE